MNPEHTYEKSINESALSHRSSVIKDIQHLLVSRPAIKLFLQAVLLFSVFSLVMSVIQFSTPDLAGNDGYYHIKMAQIMRQEGLRPDYPWLPLTILNEREYSNHHFLFHVALIPFTFGDLRLGAKWASITFASTAFVCIWWLLRGQKVRFPALWALELLVISEAFLSRMNLTRPPSLSLAILALSLHWMLQGRTKLFILIGFIYVWMYNAFPLLPILAVVYASAVWVVERRPAFQPVIYSMIGIIIGLVIHPYFPHNIIFAIRHILPKAGEATSVGLGSEWFPYTTAQLLENSWPAVALLGLGILTLGLSGRRMKSATVTALLMVFLFGWMTMRSRHFIEYLAPFTLIFGSLAFQSLLLPGGWLEETLAAAPEKLNNILASRLHYLGGAVGLLILVSLGVFQTVPATIESIQGSKPYETYADASAWLIQNTTQGERIFQTDWDDFPRLIYYNTYNTYLIGLDPTYMQLYNPELYDDWRAITRGQLDHPSRQIEGMFAARYVLSDLDHTAFIRQAKADPGMEEVYRDSFSVIFHILP
jgi:hypothetical protein